MDCDLIIVGGGPVGLATAIFAARRGLSSTVVERRGLPLDKPCGEGVMPAGVELLRDLGVRLPAESSSSFAGIRFLDEETSAEGRFPESPGMGIRRPALIKALLERAQSCGVRLQYDCGFHGFEEEADAVVASTSWEPIRARWLVGADGLHSAVRRQAGLELPRRGAPRYGIRRHFRIAPWTSHVEVYWSDEAEAYVTPVGPDEVGVALLWRGDGRRFDALLGEFPTLAEHLRGAAYSSPEQGAGPLRQRVRRRYAGRVALVGDAAGYLDPVTGEGITLGLQSAKALTDTLAAGQPLARYEREYRRLARAPFVITSVLLAVALRPWLHRRMLATLSRHPDLFDRLVAVNAGQRPLHSVGIGGVLRLVAALLPAAG